MPHIAHHSSGRKAWNSSRRSGVHPCPGRHLGRFHRQRHQVEPRQWLGVIWEWIGGFLFWRLPWPFGHGEFALYYLQVKLCWVGSAMCPRSLSGHPRLLRMSVFTPFGICNSGRTSRGYTRPPHTGGAFSTFLLRCLPGKLSREALRRPFPMSVKKLKRHWLRMKSLPLYIVWRCRKTNSEFVSLHRGSNAHPSVRKLRHYLLNQPSHRVNEMLDYAIMCVVQFHTSFWLLEEYVLKRTQILWTFPIDLSSEG